MNRLAAAALVIALGGSLTACQRDASPAGVPLKLELDYAQGAGADGLGPALAVALGQTLHGPSSSCRAVPA